MACWPVMSQLRPHLKEKEFIAIVRQQFAQGYKMAFIRREKAAAAVAGFRLMQSLSWGRFCYVDDLVTDEKARSTGLGGELLEWVAKFAKANGCRRLELDSGVQRFAAHRFYFRERMTISCYHFSRELDTRAGSA